MNITAHSSNGSVTFDADTGEIVRIKEYEGSEGELSSIKLVNVHSLRQVYGNSMPENVDILECGFWNSDGSYAPALRWDEEECCFVEQEEGNG